MSSNENQNKKLVDEQLIYDLLYGDEKFVKEFAEATEESFTEFAQNYRKYLLVQDETNFRKAGHKIKPVAQMLNLHMIVDEYEHAKQLLWSDESKQEDFEQSADKIDNWVKKIISDLEEMQ